MSLRYGVFAAISWCVLSIGCQDKPAPQGATVAPDKPPPAPSAIVVAPTPSVDVTAPAPAPVQGHRFVVHRKVPNAALKPVWFLGAGIVACQDNGCREDAFLITDEGSTESYNPLAVMQAKQPKQFPKESTAGFVYRGVYPDICAITVFPEDRAGIGGPSLKRSGKTWVLGDCPESPRDTHDAPPPRAPREFDDALLHAPIADAAKNIIYGAGAPAMLIRQQVLYVWDGKTWSKRDAPWTANRRHFQQDYLPASKRPVRLASGVTLVPEGGFVIDNKGDVLPLQLVHDNKPVSPDTEIVGVLWTAKFPWLLGYDGNEIYLSTPDKVENISYAKASLTGRVSPAKPPAPAASASAGVPEPSPSASAAPAMAFASSTLGNPQAFTAECKAPFVVMAGPPKPGQTYATTREGLRGHSEFQDTVTFVEVVIAGKTIFGVQTRNESDARQFIEVVEKSIKGMKPSLQCLDVLSTVTDRYAPPEGIRVVGINLTTGELVPFD